MAETYQISIGIEGRPTDLECIAHFNAIRAAGGLTLEQVIDFTVAHRARFWPMLERLERLALVRRGLCANIRANGTTPPLEDVLRERGVKP